MKKKERKLELKIVKTEVDKMINKKNSIKLLEALKLKSSLRWQKSRNLVKKSLKIHL